MSLFWDFWCPYRLLCHPKTGSKCPLGQKHSLMGFTVSQIGDCLKEEFQDLVILAQYTGCLISKISPSCMKYLCHKLYQFKFSLIPSLQYTLRTELKSYDAKRRWLKPKSILGHPVYYPQISRLEVFPFCWPSSCLIVKPMRECFWPKGNLRPVLGSQRSP